MGQESELAEVERLSGLFFSLDEISIICEIDADIELFRQAHNRGRFIFWWNGHQTKLFSLDRKALSNGESVDAMVIEEARLCNYHLLIETLRTVRGGSEHFGHLSMHGSILMVTDRPRQPQEKWLLEYAKQHNEKAVIVACLKNHLL